jgi:hypothetical protein
VYPAHGVGVVDSIQMRKVSGSEQKFYMISILETGMKIMVPVSQVKTVGLRKVVDEKTVEQVYTILRDKNVTVDTQTWKVATRIAVGQKPQRMALQPDAGYVWVATAEGASVIDVSERRTIANVALAAGEHEFAFSRDSRYAFVSNRSGGSVSVIDVRDPKEVRTVVTAKSPVALTYSALSNAVYAGHEDGTVVAIVSGGNIDLPKFASLVDACSSGQ